MYERQGQVQSQRERHRLEVSTSCAIAITCIQLHCKSQSSGKGYSCSPAKDSLGLFIERCYVYQDQADGRHEGVSAQRRDRAAQHQRQEEVDAPAHLHELRGKPAHLHELRGTAAHLHELYGHGRHQSALPRNKLGLPGVIVCRRICSVTKTECLLSSGAVCAVRVQGSLPEGLRAEAQLQRS